jgi:hypothetical protein
MYNFYPEWGPARNRDEHDHRPAVRRPRYWQSAAGPQRATAMAASMAGSGGPEARDSDVDRPDDN